MRRSGYASNNGVLYMLSDHLKSTSALVARNGVLNVKYFYYPYGARRGVPFNTITAKHFTGQYHETALPGGEGLSFYNARWYDPRLGRFLSADTIVPNASNPQDLNRFAYGYNNPVKYRDPTGHAVCIDAGCNLLESPVNSNVIVRDTSHSALYQLVAQTAKGSATATDRIDTLLKESAGPNMFPVATVDQWFGSFTRTHFRGVGAIRGDTGFALQFRDDILYTELWGYDKPRSRQVGHFLTAVDMGRHRAWIRSIVGHEQFPDPGVGVLVQLTKPSQQDKQAFMAAVAWDIIGDSDARDRNLRTILNPEVHGTLATREGNSMEDLRLSVRGWNLGYMISAGFIGSNKDLANWIALNVAGD